MGLDATVYCDCFEKGKLRVPPPGGFSPRVGEDGSLYPGDGNHSREALLVWDQWCEGWRCEHEGGALLRRRLGNISLISLLRSELQRRPEAFPILLGKVVHSGSHSGDYLSLDVVKQLELELEALARFRCDSKESDDFMSQFRMTMLELVAASLAVKKPIVF